ncbi:aminotransferase class I/II-fold pyridoxal phosphate-dependent enzyme [Paenibacillus massiliensis]|uniref:aminotransferase class I/II-fold pyridoxal phosphate-dependent enzyme n=1 Tax=Paenibacillus massiliensis TaxID=225917 RepID=UPI0022772D7E|nr:aminotransferase class I/II-fold pyridoxal phosphate-dependent enzyme [Paenibacillus massiliensis]
MYSTAKSICTGLRVAYVVFHERFKDRLTRAIYNVNVKTSSLDVEIITQLILSGDAHTIVARKQELAHTANTILNDVFPDAPRAGHPSSFFRWLPLLKEQVHTYSEEYFRSKGVQVYHSNRFLSGAQTGESFLRVALSSTSTLEELRAALSLLKRILDE